VVETDQTVDHGGLRDVAGAIPLTAFSATDTGSVTEGKVIITLLQGPPPSNTGNAFLARRVVEELRARVVQAE